MSLNAIAADLLAEKQAAKPEAEPRSKDCAHCGVSFFRRTSENGYRQKMDNWRKQIHCSRACADAARTLPEKTRTCETCRSAFTRPRTPNGRLQATHHWKKRKYCSLSCAAKGRASTDGALPKKKRVYKPRPKRVEDNPSPGLTTFSKAARLPDPTTRETFSHSPKDESNTKRIPLLLEQERASGITLKPVTIEQFERAARRAKGLHPDFAAMLRDNVS